MRVSGEPTAPLMVKLPQLPLEPERVKRIGAFDVPCAIRTPPLATVRLNPAPICTVVPGSMVSVTPPLMVRLPQTTIGLLVTYQVVLTEIAPLTQGAAWSPPTDRAAKRRPAKTKRENGI